MGDAETDRQDRITKLCMQVIEMTYRALERPPVNDMSMDERDALNELETRQELLEKTTAELMESERQGQGWDDKELDSKREDPF